MAAISCNALGAVGVVASARAPVASRGAVAALPVRTQAKSVGFGSEAQRRGLAMNAARGPRASGAQGQPPATLLTPDETHRTRLRAHRHRRDRAARRHGGARRRHHTRRVNRGESKSRHDGRCAFARELRRGARRMNGDAAPGNAGFIQAFADEKQSDDVGRRGKRPIIENAYDAWIPFTVETRAIRPGSVPSRTATPVEQKCHGNCVHLSSIPRA